MNVELSIAVVFRWLLLSYFHSGMMRLWEKDCFKSLNQQELHVTKLPPALPLAGVGQIQVRPLGGCSDCAVCTVKAEDT